MSGQSILSFNGPDLWWLLRKHLKTSAGRLSILLLVRTKNPSTSFITIHCSQDPMPLHMFLWHTITIQIAINQDSYVATSEEVLNIRWSSSNIWKKLSFDMLHLHWSQILVQMLVRKLSKSSPKPDGTVEPIGTDLWQIARQLSTSDVPVLLFSHHFSTCHSCRPLHHHHYLKL